jgi:hypothetical protein
VRKTGGKPTCHSLCSYLLLCEFSSLEMLGMCIATHAARRHGRDRSRRVQATIVDSMQTAISGDARAYASMGIYLHDSKAVDVVDEGTTLGFMRKLASKVPRDLLHVASLPNPCTPHVTFSNVCSTTCLLIQTHTSAEGSAYITLACYICHFFYHRRNFLLQFCACASNP